MIMCLIVESADHVKAKFIEPSAKWLIVVSACWSCMPSVSRRSWNSWLFLFWWVMAIMRFAISLVLWVSSSSEMESIMIVLNCFISPKTASGNAFAVVFWRLSNFHVPASSNGSVSHP